MIFREVTETICPKCKARHLTAVEVIKGYVSSYYCKGCDARYDAEIFHDFDANEHWWIGKLRNPDFWNIKNATIEEGLQRMEELTAKGIKEYMGCFPIERIQTDK